MLFNSFSSKGGQIMKATTKKFVQLDNKTWTAVMLFVVLIIAGISYAHAVCEQRTNVQTGQTVLFGDCPADLGVPRPTNMYSPGVNLVPVGQVYGAQNAGNVNFGGMTRTELVGTGIGVAAGLTANSNQGQHALFGGVIGYLASLAFENLTVPKPQQVVAIAPQQIVSQQLTPQQGQQWSQATQANCDGNKTIGRLNWPGHHQDGKEVCMERNDPHR